MTPPRGNPITKSTTTPSANKWRPSFSPASCRDANGMVHPSPLLGENQPTEPVYRAPGRPFKTLFFAGDEVVGLEFIRFLKYRSETPHVASYCFNEPLTDQCPDLLSQ